MKKHKTSLLLLVSLLIITVAIVTIATTLHQQNNRNTEQQTAIQKRVRSEDYPIADYESQESTDPQERARRKARNHRHDLPSNIKSEDLDRFTLKENSPDISLPLSVSHPKTEPAIPIAESDAVVIGEVVSAQAYLSNDKTNVYSEFTVRVADMLKSDSASPLYSGAQITAQRIGGRVRFPSGKILLLGAPYGENMPRIGQQYVLFLKQNDDEQDYSIITAYELRSGRVFPLDGSPEGDGKSHQFAEYEKYAGIDEATFINDVWAAIKKGVQK
jgi:hypothetical protein